jgi:putative uncharacterized protein FNV2247
MIRRATMKNKEYIENKIKQLEDLRKELLTEYQEKLNAGNNDEVLWKYISNKNIEIWTLKDILND